MSKQRVLLVHKGIWVMDKLSMPLANGYLKAYALADEDIAREFDIDLITFGGGHTLIDMLPSILRDPPDLLCFSVFGWNYRAFGHLAQTYKQLQPDGWCVMGGTHVGHQASRVFSQFPSVDIVVDGEGEIPFVNILKARLEGRSTCDLGHIHGLSYRTPDGGIEKTPPQERIRNLDDIPSPFLTGAIPMLDDSGEFLYDAVTMETNRGCPYKCAFCYWGGATGQKVFAFSNERIAEELDYFGRLNVDVIALSDANFGMLRQDTETLDAFLRARAKYSYPRNLIISWAKNKTKIFYDIVRRMKEAGLHGDFTLALQTLDAEALETSQRKNMKLNKFEDLCEFLNREGMDAYAELIWQLPGETYDSFLRGYDEVARHVSRIATYSNLLIPNTHYHRNKEQYEIVTMRGEDHDYEHVLSHYTMSFDDNVKMHRFLFWARILGEMMYFRHVFAPLREMAGITQSQVLLNLDSWVESKDGDVARGFRECQAEIVHHLDTTRMYRSIRYLYLTSGVKEFFEEWWAECILPLVPAELGDMFDELMQFEFLSQPIHDSVAEQLKLDRESVSGYEYYVRRGLTFEHDCTAIVRACRLHEPPAQPTPWSGGRVDYYYLTGFRHHLDNHEIVLQYAAKTRGQIEEEAAAREAGLRAEQHHFHVAALPDTSAPRSRA